MVTPRTGRPRGRPKGSKNVPKPEAFVLDCLTNPVPVPPRKPPAKPRGAWVNMTPEERSAYSRKLAEKRRPHSERPDPGGRRPGVPLSRTKAQHDALVAEQRPYIEKVLKKMADNGTLPDDPRAVEALEKSMVVLRTAETNRDKLAAARLVLDFTKAKPTTKVEHTIKSAEDILDEMADEE